MDRPGRAEHQTRRPTAVRTSSKALSGQRHTPRWHHGRRRELPCVPMLLPCAALRQPSKSAALAASDSLLPRTGCSLRSGCAMDESYGVSTQSSTVRGRGRAGKLTQVSFAVAQHGAAAPAFVRARSSPPSACSATLLQPRRRTTPLLRERLGRSTSGLKPYSDRIAVAVWFHAASRDTERRRSERGRKTDLTRSCEIVRSDPPTFGPYQGARRACG